MYLWSDHLENLRQGDFRAIARIISLVENEADGYENLMRKLPSSSAKIIGITGPPGSGKSSITDALIAEMVTENKKIGVICVDPSSPFHKGALLGDRIRMSEWYNHPNVFIRSLASKGSLGGLHPKIIEISDVMSASGFDYVVVETVGIGQSEVEIADLAHLTVVVLVPESGDTVQSMKSGVMEIADVFVVNKYDRPGADVFYNNFREMLAPVYRSGGKDIPVLKMVALKKQGIRDLYEVIKKVVPHLDASRKADLLTKKAFLLIQTGRMKSIHMETLREEIGEAVAKPGFNIYTFVAKYT